MLTFLAGFFLVLFIIAIVVFVYQKKRVTNEELSSYDRKTAKSVRHAAGITAIVLAFLTVACMFFACFYVVSATEVAVPITFGKVGEPVGNGPHLKAPWTRIEKFPVRPITVELTHDKDVLVRTADAGQVNVAISTRWRVDPADAQELYLQARTGDDGKINDQIVEKFLRQATGEVYATLSNLQAINDRAEAAVDIKENLQQKLENYGIIIDEVNIRYSEPDAGTSEVLARLAQEKQNTQTALQAQETAKAAAETQRIQAQAQADAAAILAQTPPEGLQAQCLTIFREAVQKGITLYVNPCGGTSSDIGILLQK